MSIEYCHNCHTYIDTDHDTDHFIYNDKNDEIIDCWPAFEAREELQTDAFYAKIEQQHKTG